MRPGSSGSKTATAASAEPKARPAPLHVAYNDGPPEITFYGRTWRIGIAQPVSPAEWRSMQDRADFPEFDFRPAVNGAAVTDHKE